MYGWNAHDLVLVCNISVFLCLLIHYKPIAETCWWLDLLLRTALIFCLLWAEFFQSVLFPIPFHIPPSLGFFLDLRVKPWRLCPPSWGHIYHFLALQGNCRYLVHFYFGLLLRCYPWIVLLFLQVQSGWWHSGLWVTWAVEGVLSRLNMWLLLKLTLFLLPPVSYLAFVWSVLAWLGPLSRFSPPRHSVCLHGAYSVNAVTISAPSPASLYLLTYGRLFFVKGGGRFRENTNKRFSQKRCDLCLTELGASYCLFYFKLASISIASERVFADLTIISDPGVDIWYCGRVGVCRCWPCYRVWPWRGCCGYLNVSAEGLFRLRLASRIQDVAANDFSGVSVVSERIFADLANVSDPGVARCNCHSFIVCHRWPCHRLYPWHDFRGCWGVSNEGRFCLGSVLRHRDVGANQFIWDLHCVRACLHWPFQRL